MEDYVERETAVARNRVEDAETAIEQEQDDMRYAAKAGLTTTKPETAYEEMLNAIGDSLSDLESSDDGVDGEDEDDDEVDPAGGKLSEDDEPGWVKGTISKTVQYRMERFWQNQIKLDIVTQPGGGNAVDDFRASDMMYGMTEFKIPAAVQPHTTEDAASSMPTRFGEPIEPLHSIPRKLHMLQVTCRPGRGNMRLRASKLRMHNSIPCLLATPMPNWSPIQHWKHDESVSFNPCIEHLKLITI